MVKGTRNQPITDHQPCSWRIPKTHDFPRFADGIWGEALDTWIGCSCLRGFSPFKTPFFPPDLGWPSKNIRQKMFGNSDHSCEVSASRCASNEHTFQIRSQATRLNSITKLKLFLSWCHVFVRIRSRLFEIYKMDRLTFSTHRLGFPESFFFCPAKSPKVKAMGNLPRRVCLPPERFDG